MIEDKETLRKEFTEVLRSGITFAGQIGDYVINESVFEYLDTKLKNQAEELDKRYNAVRVAFDDMYKKADEYYESNKQLKAELSRKDEMLNVANEIIQLVSPLPPTMNVLEALEKYKTLTNETTGTGSSVAPTCY